MLTFAEKALDRAKVCDFESRWSCSFNELYCEYDREYLGIYAVISGFSQRHRSRSNNINDPFRGSANIY